MKLQNIAERVVTILGLLLLGPLTAGSFFTTVCFVMDGKETLYIKWDFFLLVVAACMLLLLLLHKTAQWVLREEREGCEKRIRFLLGGVLVYVLCFGVVWSTVSHCIPMADQWILCGVAQGFQNGDFSQLTMDSYERYLYIHPHQLGLTAVFEGVFALFGNGNYYAFQLLNCLGAMVCVYSGYRITRLLTDRKKAWVYELLLSAFCFPLLFYVTFVYGEILSITCSLLGIWLFLEYQRQGRWGYFAGCAVSVSLACLIRNNSMIVLIAMLCVLLVLGLGRRRLQPLLLFLLLILVFLGGRLGLRQLYQYRSGVQLNAGAPMNLYVAMGMQEGEVAPGWYNNYILHVYWGEADFDRELAKEIANQSIRSSIKRFVQEPSYALWFYAKKFVTQWDDPTYQSLVMTYASDEKRSNVVSQVYKGPVHEALLWFMNTYQSLIFTGACCWVLRGMKKKRNLEEYLPLIVVLGGFFFHMLWEAKGRYILPYFVTMLPMAAVGLEELSGWAACKIRLMAERRKKGT